MKKTQALLLTTLLVGASSACASNHLLVGDNPDGAAASNGGAAGHVGTSGAAGSSTFDAQPAGSTGTSVDYDAGQGSGSAGAGYVGPSGVKALRISIDEALTRVTNVMWNAPPDTALLTQANQTGDLGSLIVQVLNDPRSATGVRNFYRWWLFLDDLANESKDAILFPAYTPTLQADMVNETETFGANVTLAMNGSFQTLMTAPFSFINADLAAIYGVAGVTGTALQQVALDPTQRAGVLTQPALQVLGSFSDRNSPTTRGVRILRQILCQGIPGPPAGTPPLPLPAPSGVTLRSTLQTATSSSSCQACHAVFDPSGLAFETFDAIGRFRTTDNGAPVDVSSLSDRIPSSDDVLTFSGPIQLAQDIALSATAQQCMAQQWLAFALGQASGDLIGTNDLWMPVYQAFADAKLNLRALIVAVLTSDPFLAPN